MPDKMTPQQRHNCMSHIRSEDTRPELAIRRELWHRGYRFRTNVAGLPGKPDIVLAKYRTAIFVNGCFWHGHKGCPKFVLPETNREFWEQKIRRNRERDLVNNERLELLAWSVITVWECELSKAKIRQTVDRITSQLETDKAEWENFRLRRKQDRAFAREHQAKRRKVLEQMEAEIDSKFHIPDAIRKLSRTE